MAENDNGGSLPAGSGTGAPEKPPRKSCGPNTEECETGGSANSGGAPAPASAEEREMLAYRTER
eukprot:11219154-Lingulodinium_polyedra.AAC.1